MDTEILIDKGRTERDVQYAELTIIFGSGDEITVRRYPSNTYVAIEMLESDNGGTDIDGIFSVGGVIAKVRNGEFNLPETLHDVCRQYGIDLSDSDIEEAVTLWGSATK